MILVEGNLAGPYVAPYIYIITSENLVYIGETQSHPLFRWGSHVTLGGSFRKAVERDGDPDVNYFENITFFAHHCIEIEQKFQKIQFRMATQAIEHEIHCSFAERIGDYQVISDTTRSAPRHFSRRIEAKSLAESVIERFLYGNSPSSRSNYAAPFELNGLH